MTANDVDISPLTPADLAAVARLHSAAFGPGRFARTAYRVREGAPLISRHCRAARRAGVLIGSVTMTAIAVGAAGGHWLLGPLVLRGDELNRGYGRRLVAAALASVAADEAIDEAADQSAAGTVILVGDRPYYARMGFEPVPNRLIRLPGPADPARILIWRGPDGARAIPAGLIRPA